ncbi:LysR family transcriptional regulator [Alginatibacterium sediminis]|uniref:LysR family transcriptional regulator n=2 Tax=Alginatibacterium sediminis TaxID=2164068 RepID=A0A420E7R5_9ALTE|nr:LysR family transcriptional regulator [Alginatibacterium sediminis]
MISLCCFESAAKHLSFTRASEELFMTQSAVSRQIKKLEQSLGCELFERVKQRLKLTQAGSDYAAQVSQILEQLELQTAKLRKKISGRLVVGVEDALTTRWLIPKLHDFQRLYPEIETEIITDVHQLYTQRDGYDIGILCGDGKWPEMQSQFLMPENLVAICSPSLFERYGPVVSPIDVLNYPFIHQTARPSTTRYWLHEAGLSPEQIDALPGLRLEHFRLVVDAAMQGLGLSVVPRYFIEDELNRGVLVMACSQALSCSDNYYVVHHESRQLDPQINVFAQWLLSWGGSARPAGQLVD